MAPFHHSQSDLSNHIWWELVTEGLHLSQHETLETHTINLQGQLIAAEPCDA